MASPIEHKQARINEHGQLTIPDEYRDEIGLRITAEEMDDVINNR